MLTGRKDYLPKLLEWVPRENLPDFFGGTDTSCDFVTEKGPWAEHWAVRAHPHITWSPRPIAHRNLLSASCLCLLLGSLAACLEVLTSEPLCGPLLLRAVCLIRRRNHVSTAVLATERGDGSESETHGRGCAECDCVARCSRGVGLGEESRWI